MDVNNKKANLKEVAGLFLKLGVIGFGGPNVHIAMMQAEVVQKRKWMTQEHFLDLLSATNLIPGPNSTEMTMHCGHERAGWKGLIVAGICFITPAVIITALLAWAYKQYGSFPNVAPFIYGMNPAIIAVIVSAMITLGKKAVKNVELAIIGIACIVLSIIGVNVIAILFGAGLLGILLYLYRTRIKHTVNSVIPLTLLQAPALKLFWVFLKIGSIIYGSGYVLFAFLDTDLVKTGLLPRKILVDAIAVGQFTPGPVFSSATFIGWQIGGFPGAVAATIGIFLPAFIFVALLKPIVPKLRNSGIASAFLDTINVAAVAIILAVCFEMGRESIKDWKTISIAIICLTCALTFKKMNSAFIILGGAALGYVLTFF